MKPWVLRTAAITVVAVIALGGASIGRAFLFPTKFPFLPPWDVVHPGSSVDVLGRLPAGLRVTSTATMYDGMSEEFGTKYAVVSTDGISDEAGMALLQDAITSRGDATVVSHNGITEINGSAATVTVAQEGALTGAPY